MLKTSSTQSVWNIETVELDLVTLKAMQLLLSLHMSRLEMEFESQETTEHESSVGAVVLGGEPELLLHASLVCCCWAEGCSCCLLLRTLASQSGETYNSAGPTQSK